MAIYAQYDRTGKIHALISVKAPKDKQVGMMMVPKTGHFVAEIEGMALKTDPPSVEEVRAIASRHKIATVIPRTKLTR